MRPPCGQCGKNRTVVTEADLEESIETVIAGYQKKNAVLSDREKLIVSYHEIGQRLGGGKTVPFRPRAENYHHPPHQWSFGLHHAGGYRGEKNLLTKGGAGK